MHKKEILTALFCFSLFLGCSQKQTYQQTVLPAPTSQAKPEILQTYALTIDAERVAFTKAYFKAHNRELFDQFPAEDSVEAIQFTPKIIVVHYTVIPTLEETMTYFQPNRIASDRGLVADSGALNVGVQFVVDRDGTIYQSYPANVMSRHVIGLNHVAIGIENIGSADLGAPATANQQPLTQEQLNANVSLIRYLQSIYPSIQFMIGHFEYQELENPEHPAHDLFVEDQPSYRTDKVDPGKNFLFELRRALQFKPGGTF